MIANAKITETVGITPAGAGKSHNLINIITLN